MLLSRTSAFNLLQGYSAAVLDVRLEGEQEDTYITEAHFFRTADWGSLRMREEILIYGSSGDQAVGMSGDVLAKLRGVRSRFRQLYILSTSLEEFADVYPFVCNRAKLPPPLKNQPRPKRPRYPSEILAGCLFHGHKTDASRLEVMQHLQITHIVNVTRNVPCFFEAIEGKSPVKVAYLRLVLDDTDDDDLSESFALGPPFIEEAIRGGGKVLVHCQEGLSRSSAVILAYLMRFREMSLVDAVNHLARCRPIIQPNEGYTDQLGRLEEQLHPHRPGTRALVPARFVRPRPAKPPERGDTPEGPQPLRRGDTPERPQPLSTEREQPLRQEGLSMEND